MKREKIIQELILIVLTVLPILYLGLNWSVLPESVPIHFDAKGEPNGYGSRFVYLILPLGIYLLMLVLPRIDPRKANYAVFEGSYYKLRLSSFAISLKSDAISLFFMKQAILKNCPRIS